MHPPDCPHFDYEHVPQHRERLRERTQEVVSGLRRRQLDPSRSAADSREVHKRLFTQLTPPGHDYFAGHYRGEAFRCLKFYGVHVPSDSRVGLRPESVLSVMGAFATEVGRGFASLDATHGDPQRPPGDKLVTTVRFACMVFERFLAVHPYANGNGHAARFITWAILGHYNYWPRNWPIEPRPPNPDYGSMIVEHRNGNSLPFVTFMLQNLLPPN